LGKLVALSGGISFQTFPNMVWQGVAFGSILRKVGPRRKLVRNLCKIAGPAKGHHFSNFSQHGLTRGGLGAIFLESDAKGKTLT
jgi:hypothetical protein